jgi:hypothetical protein
VCVARGWFMRTFVDIVNRIGVPLRRFFAFREHTR